MFEKLFNGVTFFNMLQFEKINHKKYIETFDDKNEILEHIIKYIKDREKQIGIFGLYRIDRKILSTELKECLFTDQAYKSEMWYDFFGPYRYPVRINCNDFMILKDELAEYGGINENPYILAITFISL